MHTSAKLAKHYMMSTKSKSKCNCIVYERDAMAFLSYKSNTIKELVMIRIAYVLVFCLVCALANAQDSRYAGTWKCHSEETFEEDNGEKSRAMWDHFIRIDIEDQQTYVRLKLIGTNVDGRDFQTRREGENIINNPDGSISFNDYLCKNEYDKDDHLYWTVWYHCVAKYEGGRLKVSERLMGEGRNNNGYLVKDETNIHPIKQKLYYNEKDNW